VKCDIELYYPLVKDGGVFGGHDFTPSLLGVPRAVLEFVDNEGLELCGRGVDWWVIKKSDKNKFYH
jgi:hypothetical protein